MVLGDKSRQLKMVLWKARADQALEASSLSAVSSKIIPTPQAPLQGHHTSLDGEAGLAVCKLLAWYSSCASVVVSPGVGGGGNEVI